ncbi:MAG TPA: hypothetical protein VJT74_15715 [Pyrinomonadaceae bacterium]|nr:hypothetical protein [Pyrinomonadaceae bacterium]
MDKQRLAGIEQYVFGLFRAAGTTRLLAREVFESTSEYANADLVRAFEDLEKKRRLLVRFTDEGNDWVQLTPEGAAYAGLGEPEPPAAFPHPPRSST